MYDWGYFASAQSLPVSTRSLLSWPKLQSRSGLAACRLLSIPEGEPGWPNAEGKRKSLYCVCGSALTVLFNVIDRRLPDASLLRQFAHTQAGGLSSFK
jgi:hypothetical protein